VDIETLLSLLEILRKGFNFSSIEKMILDLAYDLRKTFGSQASHLILKTGTNLITNSSKIKSDIICDYWELLNVENYTN